MGFSLDELRTLIQQSGQQELIITVVCIIGIMIALANCFAGYRLLHVWITLLGVFAGGFLGYFIFSFFTTSVVVQACAVIAAALLAMLLVRRYMEIGTVLLCIGMTFSFTYYFLLYTFGYTNITVYQLTAAAISVLCGLLAYLLKKPVVIVITALCGSYTAWSSLSSLLHIYYNQKVYWGIIFVLAIVGMIAQFVADRK